MAQTALSAPPRPETYQLQFRTGLFHDFPKFIPAYVRSSIIGILVGILPGAGGTIASFVSYNEVKSTTKNPDPPFGKGNTLGVADAERSEAHTSELPSLMRPS